MATSFPGFFENSQVFWRANHTNPIDDCEPTWRGRTIVTSATLGLLCLGVGVADVFHAHSNNCKDCPELDTVGKNFIIAGSCFLAPTIGLLIERITYFAYGKEPPSWTMTSAPEESRALQEVVTSG